MIYQNTFNEYLYNFDIILIYQLFFLTLQYNIRYMEDLEIEIAIEMQKLERELFYDTIKNLIDSNNIAKMMVYVDYMTGKLHLSMHQFIHSKIFELNKSDIYQIKNIVIDYADLDKKIELYEKRSRYLNLKITLSKHLMYHNVYKYAKVCDYLYDKENDMYVVELFTSKKEDIKEKINILSRDLF